MSCCPSGRPDAAPPRQATTFDTREGDTGRPDPVRFEGGRSHVGANRAEIPGDGESPMRKVRLAPFRLDPLTVTNDRFAAFVQATGHVTDAERYGWSAVFGGLMAPDRAAQMPASDQTPWWIRVDGATWQQPEGPGSDLSGREDHPVTHVGWADAQAFARWAGGRLPTEAEWEHAARDGAAPKRFPWGDAEPDEAGDLCNIWQGRFPTHNTCADGYYGTAPAQSFAPTPSGLFNMAGNVWEWTADSYQVRSLAKAAKARNLVARRQTQKVLKGGSFLCHISYCYRYRIAARSGVDADTSASNVGFRVAYD